MKVADVMTRNVACVRMNESCSTAIQVMWDRDCGAVPVLDETGERVVGIITDRDICMACWSHNRGPQGIFVSEAMSRNVFSCSPDDTLGRVEDLMRMRQVRRIPVLQAGNRLVGIISLADIVRQGARAERRQRDKDVEPEQIAATLATICEPRASVTL